MRNILSYVELLVLLYTVVHYVVLLGYTTHCQVSARIQQSYNCSRDWCNYINGDAGYAVII